MRSKAIFHGRAAFVSLALVVLAVAGCGGSTKTVTSTPLPPGVSRIPPVPQPITASFHAILSGKRVKQYAGPALSRGSPNGSALAVVTTNASTNQLCWQFSQLKNVSSPTVARLFRNFAGATGTGGFPLGRRYKSSGCIHLESITLGLIGEKPNQFWINIHSTRYPFGAVRGQLSLA
jgi:hypothetical protein